MDDPALARALKDKAPASRGFVAMMFKNLSDIIGASVNGRFKSLEARLAALEDHATAPDGQRTRIDS